MDVIFWATATLHRQGQYLNDYDRDIVAYYELGRIGVALQVHLSIALGILARLYSVG